MTVITTGNSIDLNYSTIKQHSIPYKICNVTASKSMHGESATLIKTFTDWSLQKKSGCRLILTTVFTFTIKIHFYPSNSNKLENCWSDGFSHQHSTNSLGQTIYIYIIYIDSEYHNTSVLPANIERQMPLFMEQTWILLLLYRSIFHFPNFSKRIESFAYAIFWCSVLEVCI